MWVIKNKKKFTAALLLTALLIFLFVTVLKNLFNEEYFQDIEGNKVLIEERTTINPDKSKVLDDYFLLTSNEQFEMYLEEDSLSFILLDKKTGKLLESTKKVSDEDKNLKSWADFMASGISIDMYREGAKITNRYTMYSNNVEKVFTYYKDGFAADIQFTFNNEGEEQYVKLHMEVLLTEEGVDVLIPSSQIQDTKGENIEKIANIYVFPFLGATYKGEKEGYMFVPDGSGILISLKDQEGRFTTPYTAKVYGKDIGIDVFVENVVNNTYPRIREAEPVYMPLFGIVYTDEGTGVMGLIKNGQECAEINAYPNGVSTDYNWITAKYYLRESYIHQTSKNTAGGITTFEKDLKGSDIYISYIFMAEDASYSRMATIYRGYLIDNEMLIKKDTDYKLGLDIIGTQSTKGILFRKVFPITTFRETSDILEYLRGNGVDGMQVTYRGWQKGGYDETFPVENIGIESKAGSLRELKDLIEKASKMENVNFSLFNNIGLASKSKSYDTGKDVVKRLDKLIYDFNNAYYLTPIKMLEVINKTSSDYLDIGLTCLSITGMTNHLYTYLYKNKIISRELTKIEIEKAAKTLSEAVNLYMEAPYDYLFKYAEGIFDIPLTGSNYSYTKTDVPFISMVLKGYIPMYSDYCNLNEAPADYILKLAECGVFPNFVISTEDNMKLVGTGFSNIFTSKFDDWKDTILFYYNELFEVNEKTKDAVITEHRIISEGFVRVTYDNGVKVYVNYTDKAIKADALEVNAKSFLICSE